MDKVYNPDLYELLEVSPSASQETIERMYRFFAQRHHPDRDTGDTELFKQISDAYRTLKDSEKRAAYDSRYKSNLDYQWSLVEKACDAENFHQDSLLQERILAVLYTRRKQEPREPGLASVQLARMIGCPHEMLEFHLWYLRDKGWIMRTDTGAMAITADGVDKSLQLHQPSRTQDLIAES